MADFDNLDYLEKGFDPASLTVPRIRSILVAHDVDYPSGAKKPQLLQIFNDEVLPQRKKILAQRAKVRRMSKGIVDADSQDSTQASQLTDEEEELPARRPGRPARTSGRSRVDESEELDVPRTRSPIKRSRTPRASTKSARLSDTEIEVPQSTVRKSRRSEAPIASTPQIKSENEDEEPTYNRRESNFTQDNPFQGGSSPVERHVSGERKRKSLGTSSSKDLVRRKSSTKRRSDGNDDGRGNTRSTSSKYEISVNRLNESIDIDENGIVADEEFTPEAQLELMREQAESGRTALRPLRPQRTQTRGWSKPLAALGLAALASYAGFYRQQKLAVGYCGVGRNVQVIPSDLAVPDWARLLIEPECEMCPQHAYCYGNLEARCENDFVLKPHPLSVGGLIPLPPSCEPDGEKVRKVNAVANRAVEELREVRASYECGGTTATPDATGKASAEIEANDLKTVVSQKRRRGLTEAEFDDLWASALGEIEGREEVTVKVDGTRKLLTSSSLARLPLGCTIRRSFRLTLARHRVEIIIVTLLIGVYFYIRNSISSRNKANAAVPNLVAVTLDRLAMQASLHASDKEGYPESWISISQLRDDVLRDEFSLGRREAVWQKVRKVVELNANVRASQREGRNGEISRVWEWIGAVGELGSGEKRRKSGRVSWGVYDDKSSPVSGNDQGPEVVQRRWEESRPIY